MKQIIKDALAATPLEFYDTLLFFSCEQGKSNKQDFAMIGDGETIKKHFAAMLMRHENLMELVADALVLATIAKNQNNN